MSNPWPADEWAPPAVAVLPTATTPERRYPSLTEWVNRWLRNTYRRPGGSQHRGWCADWWAHPEAVARFAAMWDAWEEHGPTSDWWLAADLHMDRLFDPHGPFDGCSNGHRPDALPPLKVNEPPPGWEPPAAQSPGADPAPGE